MVYNIFKILMICLRETAPISTGQARVLSNLSGLYLALLLS